MTNTYDSSHGYEEKITQDGVEVSIFVDDKGTWWVHYYCAGLKLGCMYINYKESFKTLTEAKVRFNVLTHTARK